MAKCGSCHILARAGTKGVTGPNLDQAFARAREDGFGSTTFEGIVHRQIGQPARRAQVDPVTDKVLPLMPANLVTGDDARDVAAYVADAAAKGGKDAGALAQIGAAQAKGTAKAKGGKLDDPGRPGRRARLQVRQRRGAAPVRSRSTPEQVLDRRTTSRSRATASTKPARSSTTAACRRSTSTSRPASTVLLHRPRPPQAGMEGTLTVK